MALMRRRQELLIGLESTKGTAVVPATALRAYDPAFANATPYVERRPVGGHWGSRAGVQGERIGTLSLRTELRGDGAASGGWLDDGLSALLQIAGMRAVAGVYNFTSHYEQHKTATIYGYQDGLLRKLSGCAADLEISAEFGKPVNVQASVSGVWIAPTDASVPTVSHNATLPPRAAAASLSLHGSATLLVPRWSIRLGNVVTVRADLNVAAGVRCYAVTDRDPVLQIELEQELVATHDAWGRMLAGTEAAFACTIGSSAGNTIALAAPKVQYRSVEEIDLGGVAGWRITCGLNTNNGDDELSLTAS